MVIKGQVADVPRHLDDQDPRIGAAGHHGPKNSCGEPVERAGHVHEHENAGERDRYSGDLPADDPSQVPVQGLCGRLPDTRDGNGGDDCPLERAGHQQGDADADGAEEEQGALHDCVDPDLIASQLERAASARRADDATQVAERDRLRELLLELPRKQRRALVLATYFGRTAKEISALDGTPVGTVKTIRARAGM